jgi:hypothetical protein
MHVLTHPRNVMPRAVAILMLVLSVAPAAAQPACVGDCDGNGSVAINELIVGVNILLGTDAVASCTAMDGDDDGAVTVAELVAAVNNVLGGCPGAPTPTASATRTPTIPGAGTPSATPTATATLAIGPAITFFGLASADDSLQPTPAGPGIPVYERPFGFSFSLVIEAGRSTATCGADLCSPGNSTFVPGGAPDVQVQVTRPLGDGSAAVCDDGVGDPPVFGGVPAIDPPNFDAPQSIGDTLNDLGCRFIDGVGQRTSRTCGAVSGSCVRFEDGEYACVHPDSRAQFCAPVPMTMQFPPGDTLVSARVRDVAGNLGPVSQIIVRVVP